jgi:hypothetical protein
MAEATHEQRAGGNSFGCSLSQATAGNPLLAAVTDINGKLLESAASAQKDWAEFVHRRVQEDISASQQLMTCQSLTGMQQICSQYLRTAFEQYREQSEKAVERGKSMSEELARRMESRARETHQRAQH